MGFGEVGSQHRDGGFLDFRPKGLNVKTNCGLAVGQCRIVTVSPRHDHAFQTKPTGHVTIRMFLDDTFHGFHGDDIT